MRSNANIICEKLLALSRWNIDGLLKLENELGKKVRAILQLRLHVSLIARRERELGDKADAKDDVDMTYFASHGHWYSQYSKGHMRKLRSIASNISMHLCDMLQYVNRQLALAGEIAILPFGDEAATRVLGLPMHLYLDGDGQETIVATMVSC
jgi:hypothetical protein